MEELGKKTLQEPRIKFDNVSKVFETRSQEIVAVKDYSMEVLTGEFVSIIGPSGCGKSTLIRMLDGIIKPTYGAIYLDGIQVNEEGKMPKETLRKMGFIFQQPNLLPWYTVIQNIALPLQIQGIPKIMAIQQAQAWVEKIGLQGFENEWPQNLSGGMAQRVAIARALIQKPQLLLLDEPFGALDALTREQMSIELLGTWEQIHTTVLMVTHSISEAVLLADRVLVFGHRPGCIVNSLEIQFDRPRNPDLRDTAEFTQTTKLLREMILTNTK